MKDLSKIVLQHPPRQREIPSDPNKNRVDAYDLEEEAWIFIPIYLYICFLNNRPIYNFINIRKRKLKL